MATSADVIRFEIDDRPTPPLMKVADDIYRATRFMNYKGRLRIIPIHFAVKALGPKQEWGKCVPGLVIFSDVYLVNCTRSKGEGTLHATVMATGAKIDIEPGVLVQPCVIDQKGAHKTPLRMKASTAKSQIKCSGPNGS